jgi:DNA-binding Lrp family transcriptional regulator
MLTPKEQAIIRELRQDGRQTLKELARKARLPMSTIHDKLRAWRRAGIIKRFTVKIDLAALGLNARAMVFFRVPKSTRERFAEMLAERKEIEAYYRVNNGWDFLAEIAAKDYLTLEGFLEQLELEYAVQAKESHYLLEEGVKREPPARKRA